MSRHLLLCLMLFCRLPAGMRCASPVKHPSLVLSSNTHRNWHQMQVELSAGASIRYGISSAIFVHGLDAHHEFQAEQQIWVEGRIGRSLENWLGGHLGY